MLDWIRAAAAFGLKIAPFYLPLMLGFIALNWYLKMRKTRAQQKPRVNKKLRGIR